MDNLRIFVFVSIATLGLVEFYNNKKQWGMEFLCWYGNTLNMQWEEEVCDGRN